MALELLAFQVRLLGDGPPEQQWARVEINLKDTANDTGHEVSTSVLVDDNPQLTLGEIKNGAARKAIALIEAALAHLKHNSAVELKQAQWRYEEEEFDSDEDGWGACGTPPLSRPH